MTHNNHTHSIQIFKFHTWNDLYHAGDETPHDIPRVSIDSVTHAIQSVKIVIGVPPNGLIQWTNLHTHLNRSQIPCVYLFMGHIFWGSHRRIDVRLQTFFTDFHCRRSCLTACEFGTFTLVGWDFHPGGGKIYPNFLSPTHVIFIIIYFLCFQLWTVGLDLGRCPISEPITPIHQE